MLPGNRIYRVVSKNGTTTIGRLLNEDTFSVQMIDKSERLLSFQKADLKEYAFETKSPMPSFKDKLSAQEVADVVAYLSTFKPPPSAGRGGRGAAPAVAPPPAPPRRSLTLACAPLRGRREETDRLPHEVVTSGYAFPRACRAASRQRVGPTLGACTRGL